MKIAYLINQYPKVSHTFIRREIAALERAGMAVERIAIRGWDAEVTDAEDVAERQRTHYVLQGGVLALLVDAVALAIRRPGRMALALGLAWRMARRSDRSLPWHVVYVLEASRVVRWAAAWDVSHLHAHFGTNSAEVAMLAKVLGGPSYSFTVHGPEEFDKPESLGLATKISHAAFVVAISSYGRSQLCRWVASRCWKAIEVVHCGLEAGFFESVDHLRPTDGRRLVCVGRLCEQKGQLLLVQAVAELKRLGVDMELVLAGDGDMRAEIEQMVRELDIADRVRITGWIASAQVKREILDARALVLPSFAEGLPVVIMEAMAVGRPVISTYVAGIPELVRDGVDGWLVPAGDVQALAQAMKACLDASSGQLAEIGRSARLRVAQRHDVDVEAARLKRLFEATLAGVCSS